jgi:hypothetical protein
MIFDFSPVIEYIGVTAQYSNAVLIAILPHISDFSKKLELPMPTPVTAAQVARFSCNNTLQDIGGVVDVGKYCTFDFGHGHMRGFVGPHSYFALQNPDDIQKFYGTVRINKDEAVHLARDAIKRLGYSLESVFAELEPRVSLPERIGTNIVPHYKIEWLDPRNGFASVEIEINGDRRRIESMRLRNRNLDRAPPKVDVQPATLPRSHPLRAIAGPDFNPEYGRRLLPIVLKAVDDYGQKLSLPVPRPLERFRLIRGLSKRCFLHNC